MLKKVFIFSIIIFPLVAFPSNMDNYLVDLGKELLNKGRIEEAKTEFEKAIIVNSANEQARNYLQEIRNKEISKNLDSRDFTGKSKKSEKSYLSPVTVPQQEISVKYPVADAGSSSELTVKGVQKDSLRHSAISETLDSLSQGKTDGTPSKTVEADSFSGKPATIKEEPVVKTELPRVVPSVKDRAEVKDEKPIKAKSLGDAEDSGITLSGEIQAGLGWQKDEGFLWNKADYNLNEENWRINSRGGYNQRENTFDPAVYQQLRFELDRSPETGFGFHSNVDLSPWSVIGKSDKLSLVNSNGDGTAQVQLKTIGNTKYLIPQTIFMAGTGDSFGIPEVKVSDGKVAPFTIGTTTGWSQVSVPETDIDYEVWPLRELWADYQTENLGVKVFPVALSDQAYTSDDPLQLTNHHTYWEESQWLVKWQPGNLNTVPTPDDFYPGFWDDSLAFASRDSSGTWLTNLRGFSLSLDSDPLIVDFTTASPKELWQDYTSFTTWDNALRPKYYFSDNLSLGLTYANKLGYNDRTIDAVNQVVGLDTNYGLDANTNIRVELADSQTKEDKTSDFETKERGYTYQVSLINSSSQEVFDKNYYSVVPEEKNTSFFYRSKLAFTHMDQGFESALSSYRETRDDSFWGRHLSFREPFTSYCSGLYGPSLGWYDIEPYKIGDGVDRGRDAASFRIELDNMLDNRLDSLFDVRNVHGTDGEFIENVAHLEMTYQLTDKLTAKSLGIYQAMPNTDAGIDPFVISAGSGDFLQNARVEQGKDPSLKTGSLGLKYDFVDWANISFIWEHTNDSTLAYDNFPRGLLTWSSFDTFTQYGNVFRKQIAGLYQVSAFDLPDYDYFDIFKVGLGLKPADNLEVYLDYTRNEYEWAQLIDDNMNHVGLEVAYTPLEKLSFYFRYVYSRVKDISDLDNFGRVIKRDHHYGFSEIRLRLSEDSELITQYGAGSTATVVVSQSPFGGGIPTLDIQQIFKMYYLRKF